MPFEGFARLVASLLPWSARTALIGDDEDRQVVVREQHGRRVVHRVAAVVAEQPALWRWAADPGAQRVMIVVERRLEELFVRCGLEDSLAVAPALQLIGDELRPIGKRAVDA